MFRCLKTIGFSPSVPGDFLDLNLLKTFLSSSTDIHSVLLSRIVFSGMTSDLYAVGIVLEASGK